MKHITRSVQGFLSDGKFQYFPIVGRVGEFSETYQERSIAPLAGLFLFSYKATTGRELSRNQFRVQHLHVKSC